MSLIYVFSALLAVLPFTFELAFAQAAPDMPPVLPHLSPNIPHLQTPIGTAPNERAPSERTPLPASGETDAFTYAQEPDDEDVYRIQPTNGAASYLVSRNFLQLSLGKKVGSAHQDTMLRVYPALVEQRFQSMMSQAFPDASRVYDEPFETEWLEGADGQQMQLEADPLAGPYVRIRVDQADGESFEFSAARHLVEPLLDQSHLTDDQLVHALSSLPFALPEAARHHFDRLSSVDLAEMVQNNPAMQDLEFIKMRGIYRQRPDAAVADISEQAPETELRHVMSVPRHAMMAPQNIPHLEGPVANPKPAAAAQQTGPIRETGLSAPLSMASALPGAGGEAAARSNSTPSGFGNWLQVVAMGFAGLGLALMALAYLRPHG